MPLAILLNPDDPIYGFEHMMQHREYFAIMAELSHFSVLPYLLDFGTNQDQPAWPWNFRHQQAHNDFNHNLPSNYANGFTTEVIQPPPPPPPPILPPPPPYIQANPLTNAGTFGIPQSQILVEGAGATPENRLWWTFANHQEHYIANQAVLPLPTTAPTTAGTGAGVATVSDPWWWASIAPVIYPFW